jgi:hypothetical protein
MENQITMDVYNETVKKTEKPFHSIHLNQAGIKLFYPDRTNMENR